MSTETKKPCPAALRQEFKAFFKEPDYEETFGTLTDMFWQIIHNQTASGKNICFTVVLGDCGNELAMADATGGYWKMDIYFIDDAIERCYPVCDRMNEIVFGLSKDRAAEISILSLQNITQDA